MKYGYARVSTKLQDLQLQMDALNNEGCERIFTDKLSGKNTNRPGLQECLAALKKGDILVVYKLDRLGRSVVDLHNVVSGFKESGIEFKSLGEMIDTSNAVGEAMFGMIAVFAQFERKMIGARTRDGMQSSIRQGNKMGPKYKYADGEIVRGVVSKSTFYRRRNATQ